MTRRIAILTALFLMLAPALSQSAVITFEVGSTDIGEVNMVALSDADTLDPLGAELVSIVNLPVLSIDVDGTPFFPDLGTENNLTLNYDGSILSIGGSFLDTGFLNYSGTLLTAPDPTLSVATTFSTDEFGFLVMSIDGLVGGGLDIKDPEFLAIFGLQDLVDWTFALEFVFESVDIILSDEPVGGIFRDPAIATVLPGLSTVTNTSGQPVQVPEPGTLILLGTGLVGLVACRRGMQHRQ